MPEFVKVAKVSEIADGDCVACDVGGREIAVFNLGGEYFAIDDLCPHADGPLSEGFVEGEEVECPWHGARFNIKTGAVLCEPAESGVSCYTVRVVGEDVEVQV